MGIGAVAALVVAVMVGGVVVLKRVADQSETPSVPGAVLVVLTASDKEASQVAALPVLLRSRNGTVTVTPVDPDRKAAVSGTSASTLAQAYPFGGGAAVASAYASSEGVAVPAWIALEPAGWGRLVDDAGGIEIDVPSGVSAYIGGSLTVFEPGRQKLDGSDAAALAATLEYLDPAEKVAVRSALQRALGEVLVSGPSELVRAVDAGSATSSMEVSAVRAFLGSR